MAIRKNPLGLAASVCLSWLATVYDRVYSPARMRSFEKAVIYLSCVGFLLHLALIFVARNFAPHLTSLAGRNYLAAIYTPFTIILIYEVLVLISAIPQSPTESVATQFEIVSLIFIRGFFHEIGELDMEKMQAPTMDAFPHLVDDIGGGLVLFLLITLFKRAAHGPDLDDPAEHLVDRETFVSWKKIIALAVTVVFVISAATGVRTVLEDGYRLMTHQAGATLNSGLFFYNDVFTVMIFTDVLILILSLVLSGHYELVFRNAAFVVSRTLMRFSLLTEQPYAVVFATTGMVFAILTVVVYNFGAKPFRAQELQDMAKSPHQASSEGEIRRSLR